MYYLYDKINKAVDTSRRFSSVSFITSSCNASKFLRLLSTLRLSSVEKIARNLICYSSSSEHVNTLFFVESSLKGCY